LNKVLGNISITLPVTVIVSSFDIKYIYYNQHTLR
jgi:hypothetical protein